MKTKKVVVKTITTIAHDNQQLHCEGTDCHAVIELVTDHHTVRQGDELEISVAVKKKTAAKKTTKKAAKKAAKKVA